MAYHKSQVPVLVTGFGPFHDHSENASWAAVQELAKIGVSDNVKLIVKEVPVNYKHVQSNVPSLWQNYQPKLVVHVGVSTSAKDLTLEEQAHNSGYVEPDERRSCPPQGCCVPGASGCLRSRLNMRRICDDVNRSNCGVHVVVSTDAGRYLCEFIYFASLNQDSARVAFIHVPPLNKPYTASQLAKGIRQCILAMLKQIPD